MDECARARMNPRWIDRRCARAFDRRRWCAREDDEGGTRGRTGEEKNIYIYLRVLESRARGRDASRDRRDERLDDEDATVVRLLGRGCGDRFDSIRFDLILSRWVDYKSAIDAMGAADSTRRARRRRRRRRRRARADGERREAPAFERTAVRGVRREFSIRREQGGRVGDVCGRRCVHRARSTHDG